MYILKKQKSPEVKSISIYMDVYSSAQISYRVTVGNVKAVTLYGVEIEDFKNGKKSSIYDFSDNLNDAVKFAEMLIKNKNTPEQLYSIALNYLAVSINNSYK